MCVIWSARSSCHILQIPIDPEQKFHDHLYVIPLKNDLDIILDSKSFGPRPPTPLFMFDTDNIDVVYHFLKNKGVEMVHQEIERFPSVSFFNFKDPDGNVLMVCQQH